MGNLFAALLNSSGALRAYGRSLQVVQNNIANAYTLGYVKQDQVLLALPFDPATGLPGGVRPGPLRSSRSVYLEQAVRDQQQLLGSAQQRVADLSHVESLFDLRSESGLPAALNEFFNGFSQLAVNPNDSGARQSVLDRAAAVAVAFRQSALGIQQVERNADSQTRAAVDNINRLAETIAGINRLYRASAAATQDAGLDAQLNAALEELAGYANYTLIRTADGAANVYLGGQTLLVVGDRAYPIQADLASTQTAIRDFQGRDVAAQISGGQLGALLEEHNVLLPAYLAELDTLAASFADTVNQALASGLNRNGQPPSTPLFTYSAANGAAYTLAVNPLSPDEIAAASAGAPGGNGNAIAIAQLGSAPVLAGFTFSQYYGNLAARVGRDVATARRQNQQFLDAVTQARAQRAEISGVSLDEEAARLLQFQQAYQAAGKLITVLDELSETVINLIR